MSKIFLIANNPPHIEKTNKIEAAQYRSWQFLAPLINGGHEIYLCAKQSPKLCITPPHIDLPDSVIYHPIQFEKTGWRKELQSAHDNFDPDCIVAVNFDNCLYSTKLHSSKPLWMDIYGDYLTIIQASCFRARSNRGIPTVISFYKQILKTGDIFSVCSSPQRHMLVGELAVTGRLRRETFGYEFTRVILPGSLSLNVDVVRKKYQNKNFLSKFGITDTDFVVLWCGGYNTWTDVKTLFAALELAMENEPRIHYLSIGANSYNAVDNVYLQFLSMIEKSSFRERFHMLGWLPWEEISGYYYASDVGINIDSIHYETIYGTRTRLVEMIAYGLPVISSLGSELSYLILDSNAGLAFQAGDWKEFGKKILFLSMDLDLYRQFSNNALACAQDIFSFSSTTKPLIDWVKAPIIAPDKELEVYKNRIQDIEFNLRSIFRRLIWKFIGSTK